MTRRPRLWFFAALGLLGCQENYGAGDVTRAGDAGFEYHPESRVSAPEIDAGSGPRLELVVGRLGGQGNLDGLGPEARLGQLSGGACVGTELWAADSNLGAFRRVDLSTGAVTTLRPRWEPPISLELQPWQVISNDSDRLFVSDRIHHVIVEVSVRNGTAKIIGGKPGTRGLQDGSGAEGLFDNPSGLALTPAGELYVADTGNRAVRQIDLKTGNVRTVAKGFHAVWGLAWAGDAGLFATDSLIDALFKVDVVSGKIEIVAGGHHSGLVGFKDGVGQKARFWRPTGLAYLPQERSLFIADKDNALVRRVSVDTWKVDTVAGRPLRPMHEDGVAEASGFFNLGFLTACGESVIMAGDDGSVRRIETKSKRVTTLAGMPPHPIVRDGPYAMGQLHGPEDGVLIDADTMVVAECGSSDLRIVDLKHNGITAMAGFAYLRGFADEVALDARFSCPIALAFDGKSTVFIADRDNHAIRALDVNTRGVRTVAGTVSKCGGADGTFATATLCSPSGLAFVDGVLYVSDSGNHTVRRFDVQKQTVETVGGVPFERGSTDGPAKQARLSSPRGIAALPDGSLVVAEPESGSLRKIDPRSGVVSTIRCPDVRFNRPRALSTEGETLLVTDRSAVHAFHPATCMDTIVVGVPGAIGVRLGALPQSLNEPSVARYSASSGGLIILDRAENAILRATISSDMLR